MTRQEAEVFAEFRNKKLWRMFGNWLVFEMNKDRTINFVHVVNYRTNYGLAFLGRNGELQFPNDDAVVPPKAMLKRNFVKLHNGVKNENDNYHKKYWVL